MQSSLASSGTRNGSLSLFSSVYGKLFKFMVFFSHDWGKDKMGRDNHARVVRVCRALAKLGVEGWIDEKYMQGDIDVAIWIWRVGVTRV